MANHIEPVILYDESEFMFYVMLGLKAGCLLSGGHSGAAMTGGHSCAGLLVYCRGGPGYGGGRSEYCWDVLYPGAGGLYPEGGRLYPVGEGLYPAGGGLYPPDGGLYPPDGGMYPAVCCSGYPCWVTGGPCTTPLLLLLWAQTQQGRQQQQMRVTTTMKIITPMITPTNLTILKMNIFRR